MRLKSVMPVALLVFLALSCSGCRTNQVQLYKTRHRRQQVWVYKLDPDIFKTHEKSVGLSLKVATLGGMASLTPGVKFVKRAKAEWDGNTQALLAKYTLLINDHNTAHISLAEYWEKRNELDSLFVTMAMNRPVVENSLNSFYEYWKVQSDKAFAELDQELKKNAQDSAETDREEIKKQLLEVNKKLNELGEKLESKP